jgi:hypothetical protein
VTVSAEQADAAWQVVQRLQQVLETL